MNVAMRVMRPFAPVYPPTQTWKALYYAICGMGEKGKGNASWEKWLCVPTRKTYYLPFQIRI